MINSSNSGALRWIIKKNNNSSDKISYYYSHKQHRDRRTKKSIIWESFNVDYALYIINYNYLIFNLNLFLLNGLIIIIKYRHW